MFPRLNGAIFRRISSLSYRVMPKRTLSTQTTIFDEKNMNGAIIQYRHQIQYRHYSSKPAVFESKVPLPSQKGDDRSTFPQLPLLERSIDKTGSRKSRKLRVDGMVPGVVYGVDNDRNVVKRLVMIDRRSIMSALRKLGSSFENTVHEVSIGGGINAEKYLVTMCNTQLDNITKELISVNFLIYHPGNKLKIPVDFINEEMNEDLKKGLFLVPVNTFIDVKCNGDVPSKFIVDLSVTPKRGIFRLNMLNIPHDVIVSPKISPDLVLGVIRVPRGG